MRRTNGADAMSGVQSEDLLCTHRNMIGLRASPAPAKCSHHLMHKRFQESALSPGSARRLALACLVRLALRGVYLDRAPVVLSLDRV
jgi:hypothetical protein